MNRPSATCRVVLKRNQHDSYSWASPRAEKSRYCSRTSVFDSHLEVVLSPPRSFLSTTMHLIFFLCHSCSQCYYIIYEYEIQIECELYIIHHVLGKVCARGERSVEVLLVRAPQSCCDRRERRSQEPGSWERQTHSWTGTRWVQTYQWSPFRRGAVMCSCSRQLMMILGFKKKYVNKWKKMLAWWRGKK